MMTRPLLTVLLCALALACASCGDPREAAIEAAYYDMENAFNSGHGATAVALYSADSFTVYDALLKHALESDEATVKRLPAPLVGELLMMRNRCERQQIERMDGRAWVKHATDQGWYRYEEDPNRPEYFVELGAIRIAPDGASASAQLIWDGEPMQSRIEFVFEDDRWKRTFQSEIKMLEEQIRYFVSELRINLYELLLMWEADDHGELRNDLWRPMLQRRR